MSGRLLFLAIFANNYCSMFAKQLFFFCQISPLLSSPLFCRWWNCTSPNIIWNMSWWSRTCEELGIITSPFPLFSSLLWCHYAPSSWSNDDWHVSEASFSAVFLSFCEFGRSSSLAVLLYLTCCHTITTTFSFLSAWSGNFNSWHIWASITVTSAPSSCWPSC